MILGFFTFKTLTRDTTLVKKEYLKEIVFLHGEMCKYAAIDYLIETLM